MTVSRKRCVQCHVIASPNTFISGHGLCPKCSLQNAFILAIAALQSALEVSEFNPAKGKWQSRGKIGSDRIADMLEHNLRMSVPTDGI